MNDYKIIEATSSAAVETEVRRLIGAGWDPLGSLVVVTRPDPQPQKQVIYIQAMILDREVFGETFSNSSWDGDRRPTLVNGIKAKVGDLR